LKSNLKLAIQEEEKPEGFKVKNESEDSEEDPAVNLVDFKKTTKELLQNSHVLRRPSV
jgi:hypothetical protein